MSEKNDLISRHDAIYAVAELISSMSVCASVDECHGMKRMQGMAVRALDNLPSAQLEIIRCKDCKHKPYPSDDYDFNNGDCGFEIIFPDYRCPCQCDDGYYNRIPDDDWFCGSAERRAG